MSTTTEPSSSTSSAPPSKERIEIMSKAVNLMGQGRRNLICGDVPMAVSQFEECCQILAQTYGEMAFECAPAYFSYGHALLELARMDSKVIESLEAEAEDEEEDEEEESEKSDEGKSGGETPGTTEDEDRSDKSESLSSQDEGNDKEIKTDKELNAEKGEGEKDGEKDGDKDGEKDGDKDGDGNESGDEHVAGNDVTNLQLAWESLELAKIIYLKRSDKEPQLKAAQAFLKLGEVGLETGVYDQAVEDIKECLKIQKTHLEPEEREIAESYYQLGLVHVFAGNHDPSIENFKEAVSVIEARIEKLNKTIENLKDSKETADLETVYNAKTEIKELEEVIPDIKQKITDTIEEKKTVADLKLMAKKEAEEKLKQGPTPGTSGFDAMSNITSITGGIGTTTGFSSTDVSKTQGVKTTDISHLIRRKRKPEEATEESTEKKQKSESGGSTSSQSTKPQETDTSNGPLSSTQHKNELSDTKGNRQTETKE